MYTSLRYPLEVRLGEEPLGDFTIALCGLRFGAEQPWLEGRPLPIDHVVEPSRPQATYRQELLRVAVTALEREQLRTRMPPVVTIEQNERSAVIDEPARKLDRQH